MSERGTCSNSEKERSTETATDEKTGRHIVQCEGKRLANAGAQEAPLGETLRRYWPGFASIGHSSKRVDANRSADVKYPKLSRSSITKVSRSTLSIGKMRPDGTETAQGLATLRRPGAQ